MSAVAMRGRSANVASDRLRNLGTKAENRPIGGETLRLNDEGLDEVLRRVLSMLKQKHTVDILHLLSQKSRMDYRDLTAFVPDAHLEYKLRSLQQAGLIASRPAGSKRTAKEYFLTATGRDTLQWMERTRRAAVSPARTRKMEEF